MVKIYDSEIETNKFNEINSFKKGCWISLVEPTKEEIIRVCTELKINEDNINFALDYEEKARIDYDDEDNTTLFIIDVPTIEEVNGNNIFSTMPIGVLIVRDDFFVTVSVKRNKVIEFFESGKVKSLSTYKKSRFVLQILYKNSEIFLEYLKRINKKTEVAEYVLQKSMKNKELLELLNLKKSLVYFTTSLKSNELVMEKTMRGKIIKLYEEDEDMLEDAIVENKQAIEMSKIYNDILNGTMDSYASIISNNLNGVMKFLTSITIVLSIPTMISSFWGMNVGLPFETNKLGFIIMILISSIITLLVILWLKKKNMLD